VPRGHNFDKDAPLQDTLDFNHQVFGEDKDIVEEQYPKIYRWRCKMKSTLPGIKARSPIACGLAALGLGRSFTA